MDGVLPLSPLHCAISLNIIMPSLKSVSAHNTCNYWMGEKKYFRANDYDYELSHQGMKICQRSESFTLCQIKLCKTLYRILNFFSYLCIPFLSSWRDCVSCSLVLIYDPRIKICIVTSVSWAQVEGSNRLFKPVHFYLLCGPSGHAVAVKRWMWLIPSTRICKLNGRRCG